MLQTKQIGNFTQLYHQMLGHAKKKRRAVQTFYCIFEKKNLTMSKLKIKNFCPIKEGC